MALSVFSFAPPVRRAAYRVDDTARACCASNAAVDIGIVPCSS
jgi:hypothetical protein